MIRRGMILGGAKLQHIQVHVGNTTQLEQIQKLGNTMLLHQTWYEASLHDS